LISSAIRFELALSSASRVVTRLASLVASSLAVVTARFSVRVRQAATVAIWVPVSARRASIPRSVTRSSAVSALTAAVRSVLI